MRSSWLHDDRGMAAGVPAVPPPQPHGASTPAIQGGAVEASASQPRTPPAAERELLAQTEDEAGAAQSWAAQSAAAFQRAAGAAGAEQGGDAAPQPAAGGDVEARGWLSMWRHSLALDQLFYPLAAAMWTPYCLRLLPVSTAAERLQHLGMALNILLLAVLAW